MGSYELIAVKKTTAKKLKYWKNYFGVSTMTDTLENLMAIANATLNNLNTKK